MKLQASEIEHLRKRQALGATWVMLAPLGTYWLPVLTVNGDPAADELREEIRAGAYGRQVLFRRIEDVLKDART